MTSGQPDDVLRSLLQAEEDPGFLTGAKPLPSLLLLTQAATAVPNDFSKKLDTASSSPVSTASAAMTTKPSEPVLLKVGVLTQLPSCQMCALMNGAAGKVFSVFYSVCEPTFRSSVSGW